VVCCLFVCKHPAKLSITHKSCRSDFGAKFNIGDRPTCARDASIRQYGDRFEVISSFGWLPAVEFDPKQPPARRHLNFESGTLGRRRSLSSVCGTVPDAPLQKRL